MVSRTKSNTKSTKKCRKQVIKTFSMREGWWYIGIKSDGGVKRKLTYHLCITICIQNAARGKQTFNSGCRVFVFWGGGGGGRRGGEVIGK